MPKGFDTQDGGESSKTSVNKDTNSNTITELLQNNLKSNGGINTPQTNEENLLPTQSCEDERKILLKTVAVKSLVEINNSKNAEKKIDTVHNIIEKVISDNCNNRVTKYETKNSVTDLKDTFSGRANMEVATSIGGYQKQSYLSSQKNVMQVGHIKDALSGAVQEVAASFGRGNLSKEQHHMQVKDAIHEMKDTSQEVEDQHHLADDENYMSEASQDENELVVDESVDTDSVVIDGLPEGDHSLHQDGHTEWSPDDDMNGMMEDDGEYGGEDDLEDLDEDEEEDLSKSMMNLPDCRLKRNYSCNHCGYNTQNPREFLYHLQNEHGEQFKIFECPRCIYASKNQQKLIRHARMVHKLKLKRRNSSGSPTKQQRSSVSPVGNSINSPGKSPHSIGSPNDEWDIEDDDDDDEIGDDDSSPTKSDGSKEKKIYHCDQCDYTCRSRKLLNRHETTLHLKRKFFKCTKCNYVTHLKGRYSKHLKYHQLPILKCEFCDFRTPYRWNLDRHMKNHNGESGEFKCHMCNFTAMIKQSLTVHISNHHLTPEQIRDREAKRTIGISKPEDCDVEEHELEMLRLERDEHPDALALPHSRPDSPNNESNNQNSNAFRVSNIEMSNNDEAIISGEGTDEDGQPLKKKPKIKITLKKLPNDTFSPERNDKHNIQEEFIHPDDVVQRHGEIHLKNLKCKICPFKAGVKNELVKHLKKSHGISSSKSDGHRKEKKMYRSLSADFTADRQSPVMLGASSSEENVMQYHSDGGGSNGPSVGDELEFPKSGRSSPSDQNSRDALEDSTAEYSSESREPSPSKDPNRKKNPATFFDKLQEKLSTSNVQNLVCQYCGHNSKCLSESVRHQKLHLSARNVSAPASLSTRCQFCRHRCKTTDDLVNHLKHCTEARKNQISDTVTGRRSSTSKQELEEEEVSRNEESPKKSLEEKVSIKKAEGCDDNSNELKNSLETPVFIWNTVKPQEQDQKEEVDKSNNGKTSRPETPVNLNDSVNDGVDYIESSTPMPGRSSKRVYRCPQCGFWSTTASRFHVHIVGHFNKKPYNCSECGYRSNWRWDITKHIKLKMTRDSSHQGAEVIITDETGEKNYEKYDKYLAVIQLDEGASHKTEGGIPHRKGRPKKEESSSSVPSTPEPATSIASTSNFSPAVPMVTIPGGVPKPQIMPPLTRAPVPRGPMGTPTRPGPMPFGPILHGPQMMVHMSNTNAAAAAAAAAVQASAAVAAAASAAGGANSRMPPPLTLHGGQRLPVIPADKPSASALETLKMLADGQTSVSRIKSLQKEATSALERNDAQAAAAITHQISVSSTDQEGQEVAKMVLDHEGNPEWKCYTCDFRDSERETVLQHVSLAHSRGGTVSLLHAVHRCDVCGYAAGTKRHVQLHIDSAHGGEGGITSRCEGQNPDTHEGENNESNESSRNESPRNESTRTYYCRQCPYTCKKKTELRAHMNYHTNRPDCIFKCMFCPYYVPTKGELFDHLSVHGMDVPTSVLEAANKTPNNNINIGNIGNTPLPPQQQQHLFQQQQQQLHQQQQQMHQQQQQQHQQQQQQQQHQQQQQQHQHHQQQQQQHQQQQQQHHQQQQQQQQQLQHQQQQQQQHHQQQQQHQQQQLQQQQNQDDLSGSPFICGACPFEVRSRSKLMHHRQFHKPRGSPFKCPHCTYNVTRRHLLSQHLRVHGIHTAGVDEDSASVHIETLDEPPRSDSPSPSLTITAVTSQPHTDQGEEKMVSDASLLPKLSDETTKLLVDIPLVWVSKDRRFFKMFKCRHCPHVNLRKTNIQEHEKMHRSDMASMSSLKCPQCSYVSVNAGVMSAHFKVHAGSMGQCHAIVDPSVTEEEQLRRLTHGLITHPTSPSKTADVLSISPTKNIDEKVMFYCQLCPARFFFEKEVLIHSRSHGGSYLHMCTKCNYGARQEPHLLAHMKVHTPEYQQRSSQLLSLHPPHPSYPPVPGLTVPLAELKGQPHSISVVPVSRPNVVSPVPFGGPPRPPSAQSVSSDVSVPTQFKCDQCPAAFSKQMTLQYHQSLHGADNPHKCHLCSYAGRTKENLDTHLQLHRDADPDAELDSKPTITTVDTKKDTTTTNTTSDSNSNLQLIIPKDPPKESTKPLVSPNVIPPLKLKLIGGIPSVTGGSSGKLKFKYYVEEQVPLSGVDLMRRKTEMEKQSNNKANNYTMSNNWEQQQQRVPSGRSSRGDDDPRRHGDPSLNYPMHIDKISGKSREKRYKCNKCPSAFEKSDQYTVHVNLHGTNFKYQCKICDYSVKFFANFMMHINRHKYHEGIEASRLGYPAPEDNDLKYEPRIVSEAKEEHHPEPKESKKEKKKVDKAEKADKAVVEAESEESNKENLDDDDLTTLERQHLLIQNKKGIIDKPRDEEKEKIVYYCQFCPYASVRRDAVDSHSNRHQANGGNGAQRCPYCDYTASTPSYIKDHSKVHFQMFKYVHPEGYMRHDYQILYSNDSKPIDGVHSPSKDKHLLFSHNSGLFKPPGESPEAEKKYIDPQDESGIRIDFTSGDVIDPPDDFVIPMKEKKQKKIKSSLNGQFWRTQEEQLLLLSTPNVSKSEAKPSDDNAVKSGGSTTIDKNKPPSGSDNIDTSDKSNNRIEYNPPKRPRIQNE